jgi:uncharacterized Ntn-hydrolase superfamily protein
LTVKKRVYRRLARVHRDFQVDTQFVRSKTIKRLEEIFRIASDYARGKVDRVTGEDGKERSLTILERQFWARIAAYTAQIINNIANGIDERKIDTDMDELERMVSEGEAKSKVQAPERSAEEDGKPGNSTGSSTA